jgi:hypothetical protein
MFETVIGHSGLRSALDGLRRKDLQFLSDTELESGFADLERTAQGLEAERARWLAEIDRRRTFEADGHLSATSWLVDRFGASGAAASQQVRVAKALQEMPVAREAMASGELSSSALRVLVQAKEEQPEAFGGSEHLLVQAAKALPVRKLCSAVMEWSKRADERAAQERARRLKDRRRLSVYPVPTGMVKVEGELDPENGQMLMTAMGSVLDAEARCGSADPRTGAQKRADVLGEVCRQFLDGGARPVVGRERPHLVVRVDHQDLRDRTGLADLEEAGPIEAEDARRIACDASVTRVVLGAASEPLDLGRRTPIISGALRRAVVIRDGECRVPLCDRPASWCDAHHVRHWADGGETALANLVLLCRPHHRLVHEGAFGVQMIDRRPVFRRPDGSVIEEGRAPP